ncbi:DUF3238 domain-containing protein [Rhizobium leguminosarum]|uniref:DUF3238 domain-containing protein n=1 Tax=Rhizobium leguminosarum TaxID=384 RepID=UPI0013BFC89A|nr:DUF3238 domain-containing protein [Rhizobium leguminosarum]NEH55275.1 DUF3238 domain-containing protein [Rhizobium leguminosarum]
MRTNVAFLFAPVLFAVASQAAAADLDTDVHIWFRSFIPSTHPDLSLFITVTEKGTHVIKAPKTWPVYPSLDGTCFSTDERGFDPSPTASARTTVEFSLKIRGREMTVESFDGRPMNRTGVTQNIDCKTGEAIAATRQAGTGAMSIGSVRNDGFDSVFFVKASASDPFYTLVPAPSVDFSFTVRYQFLARKVTITGSMDNFPAFEGYYQVSGGPTKVLLQAPPTHESTALSLFDLYLGVNSRNFSGEISLR